MAVVWRADKLLLDPAFAADVDAFLGASPWSWYVLSGFRGDDEQRALWEAYRFRGGPRAAPPGLSAHNYGLAVDVVLDADAERPGLQPSWDTNLPAWAWLKAASLAHPRLAGGWRFHDWPHLERFRWKQYRRR